MYTLTKEQKIANYEELMKEKSAKVLRLLEEMDFLEKKIQKLKGEEPTPTQASGLLEIASSSSGT